MSDPEWYMAPLANNRITYMVAEVAVVLVVVVVVVVVVVLVVVAVVVVVVVVVVAAAAIELSKDLKRAAIAE